MLIVSKDIKEKQIKQIVTDHRWAEIEGVPVDAQTANMLVTIMNNLNIKNKNKFLSFPITTMVHMGWKLISKSKS